MAYNLVGMKAHAAAATQQIGTMFGIKTIYGFRADPSPEHPSGRAADFMIDNIPNGMAVGQALADYAVANATAYGTIQAIWNKRIWTAARASEGWRMYSGAKGTPSTDHTNHVHLWFAESGSGMPAVTNLGFGTSMASIPGKGALDALEEISKRLGNKDFWILIGVFMAGLILVLFAINKMTGVANLIPMGKVAQAVKTVKAVKS